MNDLVRDKKIYVNKIKFYNNNYSNSNLIFECDHNNQFYSSDKYYIFVCSISSSGITLA